MTETIKARDEQLETRAREGLACRLRPKEVLGKRGPIPHLGELVLENRSPAPLEIAYTLTPLQYLDLVVVGPSGTVVSEGHFSDRFSPTLEPTILRLLPGEVFTAQVPLLGTVPQDKRTPGVYTVQAVYEYNGCRIVADPVTVTV
jgi:hypothetical protein